MTSVPCSSARRRPGASISPICRGLEGLTNGLDLLSFTHTSGDGKLTTNAPLSGFTNLAGGSSKSYTATFDTDSPGMFEDVWTFHVHDTAGISGGTGSNLVLTLSGDVVLIPEPGTLTLLAVGLIGLTAYVWRKRK